MASSANQKISDIKDSVGSQSLSSNNPLAGASDKVSDAASSVLGGSSSGTAASSNPFSSSTPHSGSTSGVTGATPLSGASTGATGTPLSSSATGATGSNPLSGSTTGVAGSAPLSGSTTGIAGSTPTSGATTGSTLASDSSAQGVSDATATGKSSLERLAEYPIVNDTKSWIENKVPYGKEILSHVTAGAAAVHEKTAPLQEKYADHLNKANEYANRGLDYVEGTGKKPSTESEVNATNQLHARTQTAQSSLSSWHDKFTTELSKGQAHLGEQTQSYLTYVVAEVEGFVGYLSTKVKSNELPKDIHSAVEPAFAQLSSAFADLKAEVTRTEIPIQTRAHNALKLTTEKVRPLLNSLLEHLHLTKQEIAEATQSAKQHAAGAGSGTAAAGTGAAAAGTTGALGSTGASSLGSTGASSLGSTGTSSLGSTGASSLGSSGSASAPQSVGEKVANYATGSTPASTGATHATSAGSTTAGSTSVPSVQSVGEKVANLDLGKKI